MLMDPASIPQARAVLIASRRAVVDGSTNCGPAKVCPIAAAPTSGRRKKLCHQLMAQIQIETGLTWLVGIETGLGWLAAGF
jgi:hypothetical protein